MHLYTNLLFSALASSKLSSIRAQSQTATASTTSQAKEGSKEASVEEEVEEEPVKFTKSKAMKMKPTFINPNFKKSGEEARPRFQDLSIFISMSSFMLYFFVMREENDLDNEIGRSLYDRIDGLEKANLITSIK